MFTELLFLRFADIMYSELQKLIDHLKGVNLNHPTGRSCCANYCKDIFRIYSGINDAFGNDLMVAITILVISTTFGVYLFLTVLIFIGATNEPFLFIAYILYTIIPGIRYLIQMLT